MARISQTRQPPFLVMYAIQTTGRHTVTIINDKVNRIKYSCSDVVATDDQAPSPSPWGTPQVDAAGKHHSNPPPPPPQTPQTLIDFSLTIYGQVIGIGACRPMAIKDESAAAARPVQMASH